MKYAKVMKLYKDLRVMQVRERKEVERAKSGKQIKVRRPAGDNWF